MGIRDEIVRLLVSHDPRRSADGTLGLLLRHLDADGAACFRIVGQRLVLFAARSVDQVALDRVADIWQDAREAVLDGQLYDAEVGFAIIPIRTAESVAGVLYVGADRGFVLDQEAIGHFVPLLGAALEAEPTGCSPRLDSYIERTPPAQFEREQLYLLLERHEWNIARVARVKGVARLTIYEQMRRWGIERRRVLKGSRARRTLADPC